MATKQVAGNAGQTATIAGRAGDFLAFKYSGRHATKHIARAFGVSLSMAKLLRAGHSWTPARLDQAAAIFGEPFRDSVWPPTPDEIHDRFDRLEKMFAEMLRALRGEQ